MSMFKPFTCFKTRKEDNYYIQREKDVLVSTTTGLFSEAEDFLHSINGMVSISYIEFNSVVRKRINDLGLLYFL